MLGMATRRAQPWHAGLIESLEAASDLERQRSAWLGRGGPHVPDPVELVCQIFDDSAIDDVLAEGVVFSSSTDAMLRRLSALAAELDLTLPPEALLASEGWVGFTREAARALAAVRADLEMA